MVLVRTMFVSFLPLLPSLRLSVPLSPLLSQLVLKSKAKYLNEQLSEQGTNSTEAVQTMETLTCCLDQIQVQP